jgi:choline dehydrogenase-like flavoprotein
MGSRSFERLPVVCGHVRGAPGRRALGTRTAELRYSPSQCRVKRMRGADRFDVAVVGAGVAGCTAARLFAQSGLRVALVERRPDRDGHKVVCTHAILSSAAGTIDRLGLAPLLEERGAIRVAGDVWTPYGGWIRAPDDAPRGWRDSQNPRPDAARAGSRHDGRRAPAWADRDRARGRRRRQTRRGQG